MCMRPFFVFGIGTHAYFVVPFFYMKSSLSFAFLFFSVFCIVTPASAATMHTGSSYTVDKSTTLHDDLYVASEHFTHEGTTTGDVLALVSDGTLGGVVEDDALLAGGSVEVSGVVKGSVRAVGGLVTVRGEVQGDLVVLAGTLVVEKGARIRGSLAGYAEEVVLRGVVDDAVHLRATHATLVGVVGKDTQLSVSESVVLMPETELRGAFRYTAPREAEVREGAKILGERVFTPAQAPLATHTSALFAFFLKALTLFAGAYLITFLFPRTILSLEHRVFVSGASSVLLGFGLLVLTPLIALFLLATGVGAVVGGVLFTAFLLLLVLVVAGVPVFLGTACARVCEGVRTRVHTKLEARESRFSKLFRAHPEQGVFWIAVGALACALLTLLSFLGWTVYALFFLVTFFALVREVVAWVRNERTPEKDIISEE
jgi:cytoskeletal protein CcmA (bactofilin family)